MDPKYVLKEICSLQIQDKEHLSPVAASAGVTVSVSGQGDSSQGIYIVCRY